MLDVGGAGSKGDMPTISWTCHPAVQSVLYFALEERDRVARAGEDVVDLLGCLEADDEGVNGAEAEDEPERGILALGRGDPAFAEDLHADHALARAVHFFKLRGDLVGL